MRRSKTPSPSLTTLPTTHFHRESSLLHYLPTYYTEAEQSFASEASERLSHGEALGDSITPGSPLGHIYERKVASATALLAQLQVNKDRHKGLLGYLSEQQNQLERNTKLTIAELTAKRDALMTQVDSYLLSAVKQVEVRAKEKERLLKEKTLEVQMVVQEIEGRMNLLRLASTVETKGKFVQECGRLMEEAESAGKLWVNDCELPADWVTIPAPKFDYKLAAAEEETEENPLCDKDLNQDLTPTRLGTANKPLFSDSKHSVPRLNLQRQSFPCVLPEWKDSDKKTQLQDQLLQQNQRLMQRLEKLETAIKTKISRFARVDETGRTTPESTRRPALVISTLVSDTSNAPENIFTASDALRLYIPQGYPPYSCFYNLTLRSDVTVSEVLNSVRTHMGLSTVREYAIALQRTPQSPQEPLTTTGSLLGAVGKKREAAYPRLFLRPLES